MPYFQRGRVPYNYEVIRVIIIWFKIGGNFLFNLTTINVSYFCLDNLIHITDIVIEMKTQQDVVLQERRVVVPQLL